MIELNCSYEESKKILELGYDFSSACTKFEFRENEEATTLTFLYSCGEIVTMWNPRMSEPYSYHLKSSPASGIIPIIPKAALEACLPEFKTNKAWFSMALDEYEEERTFYWAFYTAVTIPSSNTKRPRLLMRYVKNRMLYENMHSAYFKSAFEAFIWCHENYPAELKKKFDEVMA